MNDEPLYQAVTFISFVLFTVLLFIGAISTLVRAVRYSHAGQTWPRLLVRDLLMVGGLGLVFAMILGVRALGLGGSLVGNVPWAVFTGGIAVTAVAVYCYFEIFVIERGDRDRSGEDPMDAPAHNSSGDEQ